MLDNSAKCWNFFKFFFLCEICAKELQCYCVQRLGKDCGHSQNKAKQKANIGSYCDGMQTLVWPGSGRICLHWSRDVALFNVSVILRVTWLEKTLVGRMQCILL